MLETNLTRAAESTFSDFVRSLGGTVRRLEQPATPGPDIVFTAEIRGKPITIIAECKSQGEPRYVREAAEQLREYQANYPGAYPMVMAPFITESTAELLNAKRVGYFDLAGNALIEVAVVSNVQLYLDLINFKGRGEEQAAAIRQQLLGY